MKKYFFFLIFILMYAAVCGQYKANACGFSKSIQLEISELDSEYLCASSNGEYTKEGMQLLENYLDAMLEPIGLFRNFNILGCNGIDNAFATVITEISTGSQYRFIIYDNLLFDKARKEVNSDWTTFLILAHELGHHLNGHTLLGGSTPPTELQADEFAGFAMAMANGNLEEAKKGFLSIAGEEGSATHPPMKDRFEAFDRGWKRAKNGQGGVKGEPRNAIELLSANIEVIGGVEAVRKIRNVEKQANISYSSALSKDDDSNYSQLIIYNKPASFYSLINQDGQQREQVQINGKVYYPDENGKWSESKLFGRTKLSASTDNAPVSFVEEYALLVNNPPMKFTKEEILGETFYAIELPEEVYLSNGLAKTRVVRQIRFYDTETKLLAQTHTYESLKDPDLGTTLTINYYGDYRDTGGVLFPFRKRTYLSRDGSELSQTDFFYDSIRSDIQLFPLSFLILMSDLKRNGTH